MYTDGKRNYICSYVNIFDDYVQGLIMSHILYIIISQLLKGLYYMKHIEYTHTRSLVYI